MEPHGISPDRPAIDELEHEDGNDVDEEILAELFVLLDDGTPDGLVQACDMFLVGVPTALDDLRSALGGQQFDDARRVAHTLRGTAGAFGATRLGRLGARLEYACGGATGEMANGELPGVLVEQMAGEFSAFRAILTSRLAAPTPG